MLVIEQLYQRQIHQFCYLLIYLNLEDALFDMVCCFDYNALVVCITYYGSFVVGKAKDSFD